MNFSSITSALSDSLRRIERQRLLLAYGIVDYIMAYSAWFVFWFIRKNYIEVSNEIQNFNLEVVTVPFLIGFLWIFIYWANGLYRNNYRHSRLIELGSILQASLIGVLIVSFVTFLDDPISSPTALRKMVASYACIHFLFAGISRFIITTQIKHQMRQKKWGFRTLLVGDGQIAERIWKEINTQKIASGYLIQGFVSIHSNESDSNLLSHIPQLGNLSLLENIIKSYRIEEMIIAPEKCSQEEFLNILNRCKSTNLPLNISPEMYEYLVGYVKFNNVADNPFIEIYPHIISPWESFLKRTMDISISAIALIICLPVFIVLAIIIKLDSKGNVFYRQQRVGRYGKAFNIIKFRSMAQDAEKSGPALSSDNDPRITRIGKFMRKTRLDEFPQFYNVLIGEMSLVGPRPERQFFIDKIVERAPEYLRLLNVKPGITSLGQVKFGYAENVDQMVQRLKFDLLYIENISLVLDLKILALTVVTVLKSEGK